MDLRDAGGDPVRGQLIPLRNGLLRLHKIALDSERAIYETDVDLLRLASELVIDAIVEPEDLRADLVARLALAGGKDRSFSDRIHGVPPV